MKDSRLLYADTSLISAKIEAMAFLPHIHMGIPKRLCRMVDIFAQHQHNIATAFLPATVQYTVTEAQISLADGSQMKKSLVVSFSLGLLVPFTLHTISIVCNLNMPE